VEYGRKPWTFNSGGEGSGMYVTHDGGKTWKERTEKDGLPKGKLGRMGLAIAPSKPNVVYALIEGEKENAIYRSDDGALAGKKEVPATSVAVRSTMPIFLWIPKMRTACTAFFPW
jgi:hypothetical protein